MNLSTTFASLRKQVAGISLVTLVAGLFATGIATAATTHVFTDVPADAWYEPYVIGLSNEGVIDSTQDMYRPGDLVNRAEMAKLTLFVSGLPMESASAAPYKDVPMGQWYTDYIYTLTKNGIVSGDKKDGVPTGYFRPSDSLNRAEATKMLVNAAQMAEDLTGAPHFPDVNVSSDWFGNFVETAFNNGVVSGYPDGTFRPANNINRAEVAKMVYLSMNPATAGFSLTSAAASSKTGVQLIFSQNVDQATAEMVANYKIVDSSGSSLAVTSATMSSPDTVDLVTASQTAGKTYEVTAMNVKSDAGDDMTNTDSVSFLGYGSDVSGGDLKVSLSTETPVSGSIPSGATGVVFTCWDFLASSSTPVTVKSLNVRRVGPGSETAFDNVYLYRGDQRVTTGRSINNSSQMVQFSNINQVVNSGDNAKMCLVGDLSTSSSGGVHAFELTTSGDVLSNSSAMTGSFPLRGADQLITTADVGTSTIKKNGSLDEVTLGSTDARVAQFEIKADSAEDQQLRRMAIYVRGSVPTNALQNFKLYAEGNASPLATATSIGSNDLVTLVLASPFKIGKGETKIFYLTADVTGARTGDNIKIYFDETTDVFITGVTFGYGTRVNIDAYDGDDPNATPGTTDDEYSYVLLKGSKFTIAFNGPAAGDIAVNQHDAHCMDMTITNAAGLDVTIKDWQVQLDSSGGTELVNTLAPNTKNFTSIELAEVNEDGSIAGNLLGSSELTTGAGSTSELVTLKGTYTIASGESKKVAVIFDVSNDVAAGSIKCSLLPPTGNDQVKDSNNDSLGAANITPSSTIGGNTMGVVAAALSFTKNSSPANNTNYAKGANNATLLAFQVKAGSALDTTIKSLTVAGDNLTGATDIKDLVDSLGIYDSTGTLVSTLKSFPASSTGVNNAVLIFNNLNIPVAKNSTVNLFLKGIVSNSIVTPSTVTFNIDATSTPLVLDSSGQTVTGVDTSGVNSAVGAPNGTSLQLVLGTSPTVTPTSTAANDPKMFAETDNLSVFAFTLKSANGDSTLQDMTVNLRTSTGALLPVDKVTLYSAASSGVCDSGTTLLKGPESVISNGPATSGRVNFTNIGKTLVDSQDTYLCVAMNSKTVVSGTPVSNSDIVMGSVYFDKVQDTSGSTITVAPILINAGVTATATGGTVVSAGKVTSIVVTDPGAGYTTAPVVTVTQGTCTALPTATATVVDGRVTGITVTGDGVGACTAGAAVTIAAPPAPSVTITPSLFFKGVPTFSLLPLASRVLANLDMEVLKFKAGSTGSGVTTLNRLIVSYTGNRTPASCTIQKAGSGTIAASSIGSGQIVFGAGATPALGLGWQKDDIYTVKCVFNTIVAGANSFNAQLAPSTAAAPNASAIVWDDGNGATQTDAAFAGVDSVLFLNQNNFTAESLDNNF